MADWITGDLASALDNISTITDDEYKDYLKGEKGDDELIGGVDDKLKS